MIYNNPLHSAEENLEVAIGGIKFRDRTIQNLRNQISGLKSCLYKHNVPESVQNDYQFFHLKAESK